MNMNHPNIDKISLEAELLAVLAQPTRLRLLYFLRNGERCACEINPKMQEDPSVVSRHLVKMQQVGILGYRKEGVSKYYWIKDARVFGILKLIDAMLQDHIREQSQMIA
ncbi:metalloregulator ArsR/SmtB family transcription factor [bacterium]|nr:metalloregulator ArsR/SmtB family transcription factor [bacterium]MBU1652524.1 metalloregulator ArsR/SmtB family transcription factor [bacterium]